MKSLIQAAFILALAAAPAGAERIPASLREYITQRVDQGYSTGMAVAVIDEKGASFFCHGPRKVGQKGAIDEDSIFEIGSTTKVFTNLLMADMAQQGLVNIDDPVAKYMPDGAAIPSRDGKQITLRDLATHRSGLPRIPPDMPMTDPANPYADYDGDDLIESLKHIELTRDIGAKYEYSNLGVGLLGFALAHRAGTSYERAVIDHMCKPLGMNDTTITLDKSQRARLAHGHNEGQPVSNWDIVALAGAGALRSSARDMARFIAAQLDPSKTPLTKTLMAVRKDRYDTGVPDLSIALGWHIWTKYGATIIWHNGGTGGYHSFCGFRPDRKLGVVVLTNSTTNVDDLGLHVLEPQFELQTIRTAVPIDSHLLDDYVGYYELGEDNLLQITRDGDQLYAERTGRSKHAIFPSSDNVFFYKVVDQTLTFVRTNGKVDHVVAEGAWDGPKQAKKLPSDFAPPKHVAINIDKKALARFVGKYEFVPSVVLEIKLNDDHLEAMLTGQAFYPIYPESPKKFFYKVVDAQLAFNEDGAGKVTSVSLHQNGVIQTATRLNADGTRPKHEEIKLDRTTLKQYVGKYALTPAVTIEVVMKDDHLEVMLTGQAFYRVFPESKSKFFYKVVDAQLTFNKDESGKVTSVTLHQNAVDQIAKKID